METRRASLLIGALVGLLLSAGVIVNVSATDIEWVAPGIQINDNTPEPEFEPHIASKRGSADVLVSAMMRENSATSHTCEVYRTTDTAQTTANWIRGDLDSDPAAGRVTAADPVVASYANGTMLMSCVGLTVSNNVITSSAITIFKSTDDGATWDLENIIEVDDYRPADTDIQVDKPWLAVDWGADSNYRDRVYLCWTEFDYNTGSGGNRTSIWFARVNIGNTNDQLSNEKQLDSVQFTSTAERYKGPYVQGCQIATGPGNAGNSGNEIFVVWEKITSLTAGKIRFNSNYAGGSTTGWEYDSLNNDNVGNIGTFSRFELFTCEGPTRAFDGCLPGDPTPYRAGHIPAITVNKFGNPIVAWTAYDQTNDRAFIEVNSIYNANTTSENPAWNTEFQLTPSNDKDRREPALTMYDDGSARGLIIMTTLNDVSSSDNRWKQNSYHCHATADSGTGSCNSAWTDDGAINDNDITDNENEGWVGDYHGVASTTSRAAINTFAWHRFVPFAFIADIISYSGGGGVQIYAESCTGSYVNGLAVHLYDSSNNLIKSGFTPMYVPIHGTGNYVLKYNNFGNNTFVSAAPLPQPVTSYAQYTGWGGDVNLSLSKNEVYTVDGIYNTTGGTSCETTGTIQVSSVRKDTGATITGFFVQLTDQNGNPITTGYTPVTFTQSAGTYIAYPNDFGSYYFDHWADNGSTTRGRTVNLAADAHWELTAVYRVQ